VTDLTIRRAHAADEASLATLAVLDSARPLNGPALVAHDGERLVAAVSLADDRAIADPFVASAPAVEMLRVRAAHMTGARTAPRRRWRRSRVRAALAA
jgi:hypothetical protein